jgi:hypothetical protein
MNKQLSCSYKHTHTLSLLHSHTQTHTHTRARYLLRRLFVSHEHHCMAFTTLDVFAPVGLFEPEVRLCVCVCVYVNPAFRLYIPYNPICTELHYDTIHCTALYCTILHCTALHYTTLHNTLHTTARTLHVVHCKWNLDRLALAERSGDDCRLSGLSLL